MVSEDEGRRVVRWIVAPPALPIGAAPIVAGRPEHIAAEDEGAEAFHCGFGKAVVGAPVLPDVRSGLDYRRAGHDGDLHLRDGRRNLFAASVAMGAARAKSQGMVSAQVTLGMSASI